MGMFVGSNGGNDGFNGNIDYDCSPNYTNSVNESVEIEKKTQIHIEVDPKLKRDFIIFLAKKGMTQKEWLERAIDEALKREGF